MTTSIITPSGAGHRALHPSAKNNRGIRCQSLLELDACRFLEFSPDVRSYEEQVEVEVEVSPGIRRLVRPDFHVVCHGRSMVVVEVKPAEKLKQEKTKARIELLREHFAALGIPYRVLTEAELRQQPLQKNLVRLMAFRSFGPWCVPDEVREHLPKQPLALGDLVDRIRDFQLVMRLLGNQMLFTDLSMPICWNSSVSTNHEEYANELLRL